MKLVLLILTVAALFFSCNQSRNDNRDASAYDVVTEKSYIVRNAQPLSSDSLTNIVLQRQEEMSRMLERHGFQKHIARKDSLLFRRTNGLEVMLELPAPEDAWQANAIIAFDPQKSPLFINLKKDSTQVINYIK
jgi:hypothetical protein